ncbi:MAG: bifunctional enzyme CysN/CysC [Ilumatobacteraceae bacterium]|jgi:bifunctional enzyme CysN/CysC|nr:bifunctional enzyme CysN/CysC [Ilumatobacteraceae bacterium]
MTNLDLSTPNGSGAVWHTSAVPRAQRWSAADLEGVTVWLTGLSGSGKSAIADLVLHKLTASGVPAYVLDADNIRHGLNSDLGFSPEDRSENCRRIAEVARLFADAGVVCLVPIISPYASDRSLARRRHEDDGLRFIEVFVDTPLKVCMARDPKGLYHRALAGQLADFTGVSAPYEVPDDPELHLRTEGVDPATLANRIIAMIDARSSAR